MRARAVVVGVMLLVLGAYAWLGGFGTSEPPTSPAPMDSELDDDYAEVARRYPEFAGTYVDEANRTQFILLTDPSDELAREVQDFLIELSGADHAYPRVVAIGAQYSWLELIDWRNRLWGATLPGHVWSGIKHDENRIFIGITDFDRNSFAVRNEVRRLRIPLEAVLIEETAPIRLLPGNGSDLGGTVAGRMTVAGVAVVILIGSGWQIRRQRRGASEHDHTRAAARPR